MRVRSYITIGTGKGLAPWHFLTATTRSRIRRYGCWIHSALVSLATKTPPRSQDGLQGRFQQAAAQLAVALSFPKLFRPYSQIYIEGRSHPGQREEGSRRSKTSKI